MFFAGTAGGLAGGLLAALLLTGVILLGILLTFWASRLLSATVLKGVPSSFTLELPPFRRPGWGRWWCARCWIAPSSCWGGRRRWPPRRAC